MPNALTAHPLAQHRILALGDTGSGKTTQILTLPGKKFAYLFDSNAILSLQGHDIDYEEHLPDIVSAAATSLTKGKGDQRSSVASDVYLQFEREWDDRLKSGFFDQYDWICFDSATTLLDLLMDRVLTINGRFGQWPGQDDWGPQMVAFTNLVRSANSIGKGVFMTGHLEAEKDKTTNLVAMSPMLTGKLKKRVPLLFSDIFYFDATTDKEGVPKFQIQTMPSGINKTIRTSMKGLSLFEDVTIDFTKPVVGQGLGGVLQWSADHPNGV
jgi:hypothetical protein